MSHLSHSQESLPPFGTDHADHADHLSQNDFFKSYRELTDCRQTLLNLLQGLDADEPKATNEDWYPSESPVFHSTTHITWPKTSKENPAQTEIEPSVTQQEITKTKEKGKEKEKEKETFSDHSSPFPLLEYLQRFASYERFNFDPIHDHEMVEEVDPFPSLDCSRIYAGSFLEDWNYGSGGNVCDTTSSNAIAGPSRVTLDDLERSERRLY